MMRNRIGRTDVYVSALGFGGASLGNLNHAMDDSTADEAVRTAWNGGVRYFDTAPHYGLGLSERRLGAGLASMPRDECVVSTKVGRLLVPNPAPRGSDLAAGFAVPDDLTRVLDYSREGVHRSIEASLLRLGMDFIDIVYVHDAEEHMDEALRSAVPALAELREQGVVGAIGAGMNFVEPLLRFVTESDIDVVMVAGRWTLADRSGEPLLAACADRGVSVVAAAPLNSGLLADRYPPDGTLFDYEPAPPDVLAHARRLATVCEIAGTTLPHAALQFPLQHPTVKSVVVGMRTAEQAAANIEGLRSPLPPSLWSDLAELDVARPRSLSA